jgi:hypothetical protein
MQHEPKIKKRLYYRTYPDKDVPVVDMKQIGIITQR